MNADIQLGAGARFRLSQLGIERCSKRLQRTGIVVDINRTGSAFRVLFDGTKSVRSIHRSYIVPEPGDGITSQALQSGIKLEQRAAKIPASDANSEIARLMQL